MENLTNELAKERNRAAAERTMIAWIRTCLSLISFGFGLDKIIAGSTAVVLMTVTMPASVCVWWRSAL